MTSVAQASSTRARAWRSTILPVSWLWTSMMFSSRWWGWFHNTILEEDRVGLSCYGSYAYVRAYGQRPPLVRAITKVHVRAIAWTRMAPLLKAPTSGTCLKDKTLTAQEGWRNQHRGENSQSLWAAASTLPHSERYDSTGV